MLPALTAHCTSFLEENLHADNVCVVYEQLMLYDETNVLDKCRSFIETRTDDILASSAFVDLSCKYHYWVHWVDIKKQVFHDDMKLKQLLVIDQ